MAACNVEKIFKYLKHNNISRYMKHIYAVVKELKLAKTLVWSFKNCTGQFSPFKAI